MDFSLQPEYLLDQTHFDVILLGTSLQNTILAAALSLAGKSVLHLDVNQYYGDATTSLSLREMAEWAEALPRTPSPVNPGPPNDVLRGFLGGRFPDADVVPMLYNTQRFFDGVTYWHPNIRPANPEPPNPSDPNALSSAVITAAVKFHRRFLLDTCPQLLLSTGRLVQLLSQSSVGTSYCKFKAVNDSFHAFSSASGLVGVPASKADVFAHAGLSLFEKRSLMKLIHAVVGHPLRNDAEALAQRTSQLAAWADRPFTDFLEAHGLSVTAQSFVLYAICYFPGPRAAVDSLSIEAGNSTANPTSRAWTCAEGCARLQAFMRAQGRFGTGAFLACTVLNP
jgi:RAB protein geranylgeranyltransferase component A